MRFLMIFLRVYVLQADIDGKLASAGLVVVQFTASWCGPCRFIAPVFEKLSNDYPGATLLTASEFVFQLSSASRVSFDVVDVLFTG